VEKAIEPWGVNVPYLALGLVYWALGGATISLGLHPYFMMVGSYAVFFGMISRLFFPARKYILGHVITLALLSVPLYPFQALASASLGVTELWGFKDTKSYGAKFPVNVLVLSSPFASFVAWLLFPANYEVLLFPLTLYLLGVNVGVFSATMGFKPKFGAKQVPLILLSVLVVKYPVLPVLGYVAWLLYDSKPRVNATAMATLSASIATTSASLLLGQELHAFALGVMMTYFFNCITYSTSRYNYQKAFPIPLLLATSYFTRFLNLELSSAFTAFTVLYFVYLVKDNFTWRTIKLGISAKYLS
jgi:hypothetical protein